LTVLASAVALALAGVAIIARSVTKPIFAITSITEAVAKGDNEISALARSIGVFQMAMRTNADLNRTVLNDAELRSRRQQQMSNEISKFSARWKRRLPSLGEYPMRCWRRHQSSELPPTMRLARRPVPKNCLQKHPPTCVISLRPTTSCPHR
jgi:hypothetical protein